MFYGDLWGNENVTKFGFSLALISIVIDSRHIDIDYVVFCNLAVLLLSVDVGESEMKWEIERNIEIEREGEKCISVIEKQLKKS